MRFHLVSLPHTQLTSDYVACAYTMKVLKFQNMMRVRGHEVFTYAGDQGEAISCISTKQQKAYGFNGPKDYLKIDFNSAEPWGTFNANVIREIGKRIQPKDIICVITGSPTLPIGEAFPDNLTVEFGVGYSGIAHKFRVFESYAWRNYVYGYHKMDGAFYDEVIPNYFDTSEFPYEGKKENYYLFIGRINANKGLNIAQDVCERLGKRLIVAGPGEFSGYGEYVGSVGVKRRGELMSKAKAVFVPTQYVGPFEGVHVEAMLCGTPVITTDFGVFSETVENGVNGFRCKNLAEFIRAAQEVENLSPAFIQEAAFMKYSTEVVAEQYERYFERLLDLYGDGWYEMKVLTK